MTTAEAPAENGGRLPAPSWPLLVAGALALAALSAVYLLLHPRPGAGAAEVPQESAATVTAGGVALRRGPSAQSETLALLEAGARVTVGPEAGLWLPAQADGGKRGYLPADSVERDADRDGRQRRGRTILAFPAVYGVVGEPVDVTLAPYPLAARAGKLARGTVVAIHSVDHSYFAFRDKQWGLAFVSASQVDLVPPDPRRPAIAPGKVRPLKNLTILDLEEEPPPDDEPTAGASETEKPAPAPAAVPAEPAPGLVEPPVILKRFEPTYPDLARRAGIDGIVELEVSIDATGKVTEVEVVRGLPLGLSQSAADAVRRWTYRPARTADGPVASRKSVRIRFTLSPSETP